MDIRFAQNCGMDPVMGAAYIYWGVRWFDVRSRRRRTRASLFKLALPVFATANKIIAHDLLSPFIVQVIPHAMLTEAPF